MTNNKKSQELQDIKAIREDIRRNIDVYDKNQLQALQNEISFILAMLKDYKESYRLKKSYRMKDLRVKIE